MGGTARDDMAEQAKSAMMPELGGLKRPHNHRDLYKSHSASLLMRTGLWSFTETYELHVQAGSAQSNAHGTLRGE